MKRSPAVAAVIAGVLAVGTACSSAAAPMTRPATVTATAASSPEALLARLHGAGVACNYLPTAWQYAPGFSQIQCIRGSTSPVPKAPIDLVTLRVYESAAAKTRDLAALRSYGAKPLVGPNWAALPDPDFPLSLLRAALGGNFSG